MKNKIIDKLKSFLYSIPFGMKGADNEIMGGGEKDTNGTTINQEINDKRVAKHLLKGEITEEVKELRYRTYKVDREADNYQYVGTGEAAIKKESKKRKPSNKIKFTQENKLICNDILSELNRINDYGVEKYTTEIGYSSPVRFKLEEFMKSINVEIDDNKKAVTTLRFDDIPNQDNFKSKPFLNELSNLHKAFSNKDEYGINRSEYSNSIMCMSFFTFKSNDDEKSAISYTFESPKLIGVKHYKGEYKLVYEWDSYNRNDLTTKFFNAELEEKYETKEKKPQYVERVIDNIEDNEWFDHYDKTVDCSSCGKKIYTFREGVMFDAKTGLPLCVDCYNKKYINEK